MGYYTNFELSIHAGAVDLTKVREVLLAEMGLKVEETAEDHKDWYFLIDGDVLLSSDSMKWYDHDEDCAAMSKKSPDVVFKLHGAGEQSNDLWNTYYRNGFCQICRAQFVFPPYDASKLKTVRKAQEEDGGRP